jgi:hypothetical protein
MVSFTVKSGLVTAVLGAASAGLTYFASAYPQDAGYVGLVVAILTAFIEFEEQGTVPPAPAPA